MKNQKGFTLIELLVVISIIGLLSSVVLAALSSARSKARDAKRRSDLAEYSKAAEMLYIDTNVGPTTTGYIEFEDSNLYPAFVPKYMPSIPIDPGSNGGLLYMYYRKDYLSNGCGTTSAPEKYAFYARLENPTATDIATLVDGYDQCVKSGWLVNYKVGN